MKKTIIAIITLAAVSCMKDIAPDANLGVSLSEGRYEAGKPVTFSFEGDPDNIVFYSGENGHRYENRHRIEADSDIYADFTTELRSGDSQSGKLSILVSTDFNGVYDAANVAAAHWKDITDEFRLASGNSNFPSGRIKLDEYLADTDKGTFFIAFKYTGASSQWIVRTLDVSQVSPEGVTASMSSMETAGWSLVDCANTGAQWNYDGSRLYFNGTAGDELSANEDWAISAPLNSRSIDPDTGVALKNLSTTMSEFTYTYNEPGTYKAVFETSSVWYSDSKHSLTEVEVTVVGEPSVVPEPEPVLTITADKAECSVGDEVAFTLSGEGVSHVTLWSGDAGHDWEHRNTTGRAGDIAVSFKSYVRYLTSGNERYDNLRFLVSADFNGQFTEEDIDKARWTDLSGKFTFSKGKDNTESGEVRLNEYLSDYATDDNVYIAFKYTNEANWKNQWILRGITVNAVSPDGVASSLATMATIGWTAINIAGDADVWDINSPAQALIYGKEGNANEDWIISKAFVRAIGPDTGVSSAPGTHTHVFTKAGTYNVVADYFNGTAWKQARTTVKVN